MSLYTKFFSTPNHLISLEQIRCEKNTLIVRKLPQRGGEKTLGRSLAIREVDAGSTNACEQELTALTNPYYDAERFGIHFVASPRHADMLLVTGPVTRTMVQALKRTYEATPEPKIVVAVGDDAIDGGLFRGSYATLDGVHTVIPVHFQIAGDPPSALNILSSLISIMDIMNKLPS